MAFVVCSPARAQEIPDIAVRSLHAAKGLEIDLWASEPMVCNPTGMDIDSRGRIWIAEGLNYRMSVKQHESMGRLEGADRIKILEDTDGDGVADSVKVFADQIFPVPLGLAVEEIWADGKYCGARVYIGNAPNLLVLEDTDGDDQVDRRYPLLTGFHGIDSDHGLHGMNLAIDGKLYFTQGDARYGSDKVNAREATFDVIDKSGRHTKASNFGTTLRVNLDGTQFEVLASGQRNNYETSLDSFGNIFCSDNDDDGNRGCRMLWIMDGGHYGYQEPRSTRHWAEELPGIIPKLVGTGNGAPAGLTVYEGDLLPAEYSNAIFQVDAGTHQVNVHRLVRHGAGFRSDYQVLIKSDDSWFRPVDVTVAPDGSVFVCDWYDAASGGNRFSDQTTGRIYRLRPEGLAKSVRPSSTDFGSADGLLKALQSPNNATRFVARQLLVQRGHSARAPVHALFEKGRAHERARALHVLADLPETGRRDVVDALRDQDPRIRECALQILVRDVAQESVVANDSGVKENAPAVNVLNDVLPLVDDPDAGVRRTLLMGLRNVATADAGPALVKLATAWDGKDRFYLEAVRAAIQDREAWFVESLFERLTSDAIREGWTDESVATPPYYPITSNDAFPRSTDEVPPANAASKIIGLAWVLERAESLAALGDLLKANQSPFIEQASYMALSRIQDPKAGQLLIERYLTDGSNRSRQKELLKRLSTGLSGPWKSLSSNADLRNLIRLALLEPGLQVDAIHTIARGKLQGYGEQLLDLARSETLDLSARAAAIEAIGQLVYEPARPWLQEVIVQAKSQSRGGPLAIAAISASIGFQTTDALESQIELIVDGNYPLDMSRHALQLAVTTSAGVDRMLSLYKDNKIPEVLVQELQFQLHNHPDRRVRQLAATAIPLPPPVNGERIHNPQSILALQSDPMRGQVVFHQNKDAACSRCHRVQGLGNALGPDLSSIGTKYGSKELLYHILNPSGAINYNYVAHSFLLDGGRVLNGLIVDRRDGRVSLQSASGEQTTFAEDEIEEERAQSQSLMPDGLANRLTEQELADLVDYLSTLNKPVLTPTQYLLLGPLPMNSVADEKVPDIRSLWPAHDGSKTNWQTVIANSDGKLDLSSWMGAKQERIAVVYLPVESPLRQDATLVFRCDSPIEVHLDARRIALDPPDVAQPQLPRTIKVPLKRGVNHLVIQVASGHEQPSIATTIVSDQELCTIQGFRMEELSPSPP